MKNFLSIGSLIVLAPLIGCNEGTSGGPGATNPPSQTDRLGQEDGTFSLDTPMMATKLAQGESTKVLVEIDRGDNFSEDVSLEIGQMPPGVTLEAQTPRIARGEKEATFVLKAAKDAALGDFTVSVTGHPTKGADAVTELAFSISKSDVGAAGLDVEAAELDVEVAELDVEVAELDVKVAEEAAAQAADDAQWNAYTAQMQKNLDAFDMQYDALTDRAAEAQGEQQTALNTKLAVAKTKFDAAADKLDDLKTASVDRRDALRDEMNEAFEALKKALV